MSRSRYQPQCRRRPRHPAPYGSAIWGHNADFAKSENRIPDLLPAVDRTYRRTKPGRRQAGCRRPRCRRQNGRSIRRRSARQRQLRRVDHQVCAIAQRGGKLILLHDPIGNPSLRRQADDGGGSRCSGAAGWCDRPRYRSVPAAAPVLLAAAPAPGADGGHRSRGCEHRYRWPTSDRSRFTTSSSIGNGGLSTVS